MQTGKSEKGTVIHLVQEIPQKGKPGVHYFARCDKKINVTLTDEQDLTSVSCAKCKKYADYKAALAELEKVEPSTETPPEPKPKAKPKPNGTAKKKAKPAPEPKSSPEPKSAARTEPEPKSTKKSEKLTTENYKEKMNEANAPEKSEKSVVPFVSGKAPNKKIFIRHVPSGQTMFNDVDPKAEVTCLKYLNNVKIKWLKKEDECPKGFITACRGAFQAAYKSLGIKTGITGDIPSETPEQAAEKAAQEALALLTPTAGIGSVVALPNHTYKLTEDGWIHWDEEDWDTPETKDTPKTKDTSKRRIKRRTKTKDKPKRQIKRRAKTSKSKGKSKRQIKRRTKTKDKPKTKERFDKYGFVKGDIRSFIAALMENGEVYQKIVKKTMKKYGLPETKVKGKVQLIVRIFRQRKIPLTVVFMETKEKDYYHIV